MMLVKPEETHKLNRGLIIAVTAVCIVLVLLTSLGGAYVYKLQSQCHDANKIQPHYNDTYRYHKKDKIMNLAVDHAHRIEKIITRDLDGNLQMETVLDYNRRLITVYDPEIEQCFLIGGIHAELGSFEESVKLFTGQDSSEKVNSVVEITYAVKDTNPVNDLSLVPSDMVQFCSKSNLFWVERVFSDNESVRQKRRGRYVRVILENGSSRLLVLTTRK